jgi:hypothetical protein
MPPPGITIPVVPVSPVVLDVVVDEATVVELEEVVNADPVVGAAPVDDAAKTPVVEELPVFPVVDGDPVDDVAVGQFTTEAVTSTPLRVMEVTSSESGSVTSISTQAATAK